MCCDARVRIGFSPSHCSCPSCIVSPITFSPLVLLCSLSQHCWFVLCLCDRVVSLWDSGVDLCWWKGVWYLLSAHHCVVVCVSAVCVMAVRVSSCRIVLWVMEWRGVVSSLVFLFSLSFFLLLFLFVLVFGVVRAQLCEHARYPRTPLHLTCCLLCLVLSCLLCSPPFFCWNGGV